MTPAQAGVPSETILGAGGVAPPVVKWKVHARFHRIIGQLAWRLGLELRKRI